MERWNGSLRAPNMKPCIVMIILQPTPPERLCRAGEAKKILADFFDYYNNHLPDYVQAGRLHQATCPNDSFRRVGYITPRESYYGLNRDYTQRRLKAKSEKLNQRKQYWAKSGDLLTFSKS